MGLLLFDIGGTDVKYGWYEDGRWQTGLFPVRDETGDEHLPEALAAFCRSRRPEAIGISAPGPFDYESGTSRMTQKLPSLYHVSLRAVLERVHPDVPVLFLHDAVAFFLGAAEEMPSLIEGNKSVVMLGTGLGYLVARDGRVAVDAAETPASKMWNYPYRDSTGEAYVSATALLTQSRALGYTFADVKEMADRARAGDAVLLSLFADMGQALGELLNAKQKEDGFTECALGGGISRSWDLMQAAYEAVCPIPCRCIADPSVCALNGMRRALALGKERIYL